jgi:hypothetical protein
MHAVVRAEEGSAMSQELAVGRVIQRFDTGDPGGKVRFRMLDVIHELRLRVSGARYQYRARRAQGDRHPAQELGIDRRMTAVARVRFVVDVLMRMLAADGLQLALVGVEVKDFRLAMIDPDEGVIVIAHCSNL